MEMKVPSNLADASALHQAHQRALLTLLREFDRVCKALQIPYVLFAGTLLGAVRHQGFIPWDDDLDVLMMRKDYERFLAEAPLVLNSETFYLQKEFSEHWPMFFSKLRLNGTTCLEKYHPKDPKTHQGIYIDIFPCDDAAKHSWGRKLQFYASKVVIAKSLNKRGYETDSKKKKLFMGICKLLPLAPFLKIARKGHTDSAYIHSFLGAGSSFSKNIYSRDIFESSSDAAFEDGIYPIPSGHHRLLEILYGDYMELPPPEERAIKQHSILIDLENSYEIYENYREGMKFDLYTRSIR